MVKKFCLLKTFKLEIFKGKRYNTLWLFNLSYYGGGGLKVFPLFLFVKIIEKVIRLSTVLNFFFSGGCEDRAILWTFFT